MPTVDTEAGQDRKGRSCLAEELARAGTGNLGVPAVEDVDIILRATCFKTVSDCRKETILQNSLDVGGKGTKLQWVRWEKERQWPKGILNQGHL